MAQLVSEATPKARKRHFCEECGRDIVKGQTYKRQFISDGGDAWTFKAHTDCIEMSNELRTRNNLWGNDWYPIHEIVEGNDFNAWRGFYPHVVCRLEYRTTPQ